MKIKFGKRFVKKYDKADQKIKDAVKKRIDIFRTNPFHPLLNNHQLTGNYSSYRSINITGDWRALYTKDANERGETVILFEILGTHSQLYK